MIQIVLEEYHTKFKEETLEGRYICNDDIEVLISNLSGFFEVEVLGKSIEKRKIYSLTIGNGPKRILMWSQMHGNESTTTKALFDFFKFLNLSPEYSSTILNSCTIKIIPILNPDGAYRYTRENAANVDLNRDAQLVSQPESAILKSVFESFKPHFCFNLHGQRTIFSAGKNNKPATLSFLAPAQDKALSITENRKKAMQIIAYLNTFFQDYIPGQVGIYDDAFNINCVGDTFQKHGVPTVLFEAGHFPNDYNREITRFLIFQAYVLSLNYLALNNLDGKGFETYFEIPKNEKLFYDLIIRNALVNNHKCDVAIQYQEKLIGNSIEFIPKVMAIEILADFFGHKELDADNSKVMTANNEEIYGGYENDFVKINNENISLKVN